MTNDQANDCLHGVTFDVDTARRERLAPYQVRERWPRLDGECPKNCGFNGIAYASFEHYLWGDW